MRPVDAYGALVAIALLTAAAFVAPAPALLLLAAGAFAAMRSGRRAFAFVAAGAILLNAGILGLLRGTPAGAWEGAVGGLRITAALGVNLAFLQAVRPIPLLDALRLSPRATRLVAAVVVAAHEVGRDHARLRLARRLEGPAPRSALGRLRDAAGLLPPLFVAAHARARTRREALRLAGHDTPRGFEDVVAVAALAAAGRLAFLALPNVAPTFVVVFLGGMIFGARVGVAGALLAMVLTDILLTGLYPLGFVNAPAMALVALMGAALARVDWGGASPSARAAGAMYAASAGIVGTLVFSVVVDTATWLVVAPGDLAAWRGIVLLGLAFNALPALANGALFAISVGPVWRAFQARSQGGARPTRGATEDPASPGEPPATPPTRAGPPPA